MAKRTLTIRPTAWPTRAPGPRAWETWCDDCQLSGDAGPAVGCEDCIDRGAVCDCEDCTAVHVIAYYAARGDDLGILRAMRGW